MRTVRILGLAGGLICGAMAPAAAWGPSTGRAAASPSRGRVVDLLASPKVPNIDFQATSVERAQRLIASVVDTYLRGTEGRLPGDEARRLEWLEQLVLGFGDTTLKQEYRTLLGTRQLVVNEERDAVDVGRMFGEAALLVERIGRAGGGPVNVRSTARRVFADVMVDTGSPQSLVEQIRVQLRRIGARSPKHLRDYFVPRGSA